MGGAGFPGTAAATGPPMRPALMQLQAVFHSGTRHAMERRSAELVLRVDEHDGAPPLVRVDLDKGQVLITRPDRPSSAGA